MNCTLSNLKWNLIITAPLVCYWSHSWAYIHTFEIINNSSHNAILNRGSLDKLVKANQKLKNGCHAQNWMHLNGLKRFCLHQNFQFSFIHLAHTPLHINNQSFVISIKDMFNCHLHLPLISNKYHMTIYINICITHR